MPALRLPQNDRATFAQRTKPLWLRRGALLQTRVGRRLVVAARHALPVAIVANAPIAVPRDPAIRRIHVAEGPDVADDWIAARAHAGAIVVTADIPLAARCVKAGASVIAPNGRAHTEASIGATLATRNLMDELRSAGEITGGPRPFAPARPFHLPLRARPGDPATETRRNVGGTTAGMSAARHTSNKSDACPHVELRQSDRRLSFRDRCDCAAIEPPKWETNNAAIRADHRRLGLRDVGDRHYLRDRSLHQRLARPQKQGCRQECPDGGWIVGDHGGARR